MRGPGQGMWKEAQGLPSSVMPPSLHPCVHPKPLGGLSFGTFKEVLLQKHDSLVIGHWQLSSVSRPSPHPRGV